MNTTLLDRESIAGVLRDAVAAPEWIRAAWFGGSDASGRTDDLSDIDLVVITEDNAVERAFTEIERALTALAPIEITLRLSQPTWHGHEQAIYRLERTRPEHIVDLVVMKSSAGDRLLESERHGDAMVIVDRDDLIRNAPPLDQAAHDERVMRRRAEIPMRFRLFQCLVTKALDRGHLAEAVERHVAFTMRPLVERLRVEFCPERFDFGLRYLDRDLPEHRPRIERLLLAGDAAQLRANHTEAVTWFEEIERG